MTSHPISCINQAPVFGQAKLYDEGHDVIGGSARMGAGLRRRPDAYRADAESLPLLREKAAELDERPLIRTQAFGEAIDPRPIRSPTRPKA